MRAVPLRVGEPSLLSWFLTPWNPNWKFTVLPLKRSTDEKNIALCLFMWLSPAVYTISVSRN